MFRNYLPAGDLPKGEKLGFRNFVSVDWLFNFSDIAINIYGSAGFSLGILFIKILAGLFSLLFFIGIVYFLRSSSYLENKYFQDISDFMRVGAVMPSKEMMKRWREILRNLESSEEANWKLAVLDADNILDTILKGMGYKGETLDEKLSQVEPIHIQNIDQIVRAHEARHQIARNPNYKLTQERAREVINVYKKTFENFELI